MNEQVNKLIYIYWNLQIKEWIEDQKNYWFNKNKNDQKKDEDEVGEYAPNI